MRSQIASVGTRASSAEGLDFLQGKAPPLPGLYLGRFALLFLLFFLFSPCPYCHHSYLSLPVQARFTMSGIDHHSVVGVSQVGLVAAVGSYLGPVIGAIFSGLVTYVLGCYFRQVSEEPLLPTHRSHAVPDPSLEQMEALCKQNAVQIGKMKVKLKELEALVGAPDASFQHSQECCLSGQHCRTDRSPGPSGGRS